MTKEEKHLWYDFLRMHPARFRKQKIIGSYIVDFYSPSEKLAIEIDGEHHYSTHLWYDNKRTDYINKRGISVLRFSNSDINNNFDGVCQYINEYIMKNHLKTINDSPLDRF